MKEEFEKMRAEFEDWYLAMIGKTANLMRNDAYYDRPRYGNAKTDIAWLAWQASRKQALEEAEEKIAHIAAKGTVFVGGANAPGGWIDDLRHASQPGSDYAEGYTDAVEIIAVYVDEHCVDGSEHADVIRRMKRPEKALASQPGSGEAEDERAAFHSFVNGAGGHTMRRADGSYVSSMTELWWKCWKARASLDGRREGPQ